MVAHHLNKHLHAGKSSALKRLSVIGHILKGAGRIYNPAEHGFDFTTCHVSGNFHPQEPGTAGQT